ncbi:MAG TPA: insulinase family protein [Deltaproteobacteria bacterium]|nr:insulinase family protein [Deltaproteobacteria bacterium]
MVRRFILIPVVILVFFTGIGFAQDAASSVQIDVKEFFLENGMQFLIVERPTTPQVAARLAIRAGSALEDTGKTGIAHLLEHMLFKGTKNFGTSDPEKDETLQSKIEAAYQVILKEQKKRDPDKDLIQKKYQEMEVLRQEVQKIYVPQAFSSQLGKNGAVNVNAFTTKDQTQYVMSVPSDMMEQWFAIVSEQLFEPSWREFYVEKEVVQREWAFRYVNNPAGAAWLDLDTTAYVAHPYRNPIIGWKTDMEAFSTQKAMEFHKRFYNPANAVCVLVGDITLEKARRFAKIYFERYPEGERAPEHVTREPPQKGPRKSIHYLKGARTPLVRIGFHGAGMGTSDFYAIDALTMVLSHGISARITQHIVNMGLASQAWAYNPDNRYGGMIIFGGSPNEPDELKQKKVSDAEKREIYRKACEAFENLLLAEADKLKDELVTIRELQRIKKLNQRDFLDRIRSNEALAGTLATLEVQMGWRYLMTYLDQMSKVTPEDIRDAAGKYIKDDNKTTVFVIPGGKPDRPPEAYTEVRSLGGSAADKIVKPTSFENHSIYPTPAGWKHPLSFERVPQKIVYPASDFSRVENVPLFFLADKELPFIDLALLVKAGEVDVPESKTGLTHLVDQILVRGGTKTRTPSELALALDENAIHLSVSIGEEDTVIRLSVMKADWEKGLSLLKEVLLQPRFDSKVLQVIKEQIVMDLKRQGEDAQAVSIREAKIWRFKGHPYGRDPLLAIETIPSISEKDLAEFIQTYFAPDNMVAAMSGDISKEEAIESLSRFFETFPKGGAPVRKLQDPQGTPAVLSLIHKPGQVQSQVLLTLPSVKRTHPDFWKISLLLNIFGGNDSLMYKRLRDDLGLVYSAGFHQTYKWNAGYLIGYLGCKGDQTTEAIVETLNIMKAFHGEIPQKMIDLKRLDTLNSFVFNVDSPFELVEVYSRYFLRQEPLDTLDRIQDAFIGASKEELESLAGAFLNPEKVQIFIVADKTIPVKRDGVQITLEKDLIMLAKKLEIPFKEIELR